MSREERIAYIDNPALSETRVQPHVSALRWAEHVLVVIPAWVHGPHAMLRGWLERVWLPGVAFLPAARKGRKTVHGLRHVRCLTVVITGAAPRWWLGVVGNSNSRLFTRAIRGLYARRCAVSWLQPNDMNNVTAGDREPFLLRVRSTVGALT